MGNSMKTDWMGRYRDLVAALILHGNVAVRAQANILEIGDGIRLRSQQWEIFEYIVNHRGESFSMIDISYCLSIPPSTFSKTVKLLCGYGLVEKYQTPDNRKNVLLRPTDYGLRIYESVSLDHVRLMLQGFFDALRDVSDEDLRAFTRAVGILDNAILPERQEEETALKRLP